MLIDTGFDHHEDRLNEVLEILKKAKLPSIREQLQRRCTGAFVKITLMIL